MEQPFGETQSLPLVRVITLGPFVCERQERQENGKCLYHAMTSEDWQGRGKALTLLKVLLCQPNRRATRDALIDLLWTEEEQHEMKDVRGALKTTAVLLRDILRVGSKESLLITLSMSDELMLAEQHRLWVDADAFEALIHEAVRMANVQDALPLWEQAHVLAQGEFLADERYSEWAITRRDILRGKRGQCITALADLWTAQGHLDRAQDILWDAATAVPVDEDALCRLLSLLEQQERYHAAWQLYIHAKDDVAKDERRLTPRVRTLAKRIRAKLVEIEPYAPSQTLTAVRTDISISNVWNFEPSASGLFIPSLSLPQSVPMEVEQKDWARWFGTKLACILSEVNRSRHSSSSLVYLQEKLDQELSTMKPRNNDNEYTLSRREALVALASLPTVLLTTLQQGRSSAIATEEALSQCTTSITACWHLLKGNEFPTVEEVIPKYLPLLDSLVRQSSSYRQASAHLASQCCLLLSIVARHRGNLHHLYTDEWYCQQAVSYSLIADDNNLSVATLKQLADTHYYNHRYQDMKSAYEKAASIIITASSSRETAVVPLLKNRVFAGLADACIKDGDVEKAKDYLHSVREMFPECFVNDYLPLYADCGIYSIFLWEGLTHLDLGEQVDQEYYTQANATFARANHVQSKAIIPERTRLEIITHEAATYVKLGNLEQFCDTLQRGAEGISHLNSQKRRQELIDVYVQGLKHWPHEARVKDLADMMV